MWGCTTPSPATTRPARWPRRCGNALCGWWPTTTWCPSGCIGCTGPCMWCHGSGRRSTPTTTGPSIPCPATRMMITGWITWAMRWLGTFVHKCFFLLIAAASGSRTSSASLRAWRSILAWAAAWTWPTSYRGSCPLPRCRIIMTGTMRATRAATTPSRPLAACGTASLAPGRWGGHLRSWLRRPPWWTNGRERKQEGPGYGMQHVCGGFEIPLHQMVMMLSNFCCMDFIPPSVGQHFWIYHQKTVRYYQGHVANPSKELDGSSSASPHTCFYGGCFGFCQASSWELLPGDGPVRPRIFATGQVWPVLMSPGGTQEVGGCSCVAIMPGSAFPCKQGTLYFVAPKTSKTSTASCAVRAGARSRKSVWAHWNALEDRRLWVQYLHCDHYYKSIGGIRSFGCSGVAKDIVIGWHMSSQLVSGSIFWFWTHQYVYLINNIILQWFLGDVPIPAILLYWRRKPIISSWNLHFCCFLMCETRSDMVRNYCRISRSALPRTGRSTASSMTLSGQIGGCMKLWCSFLKCGTPKSSNIGHFWWGKQWFILGYPSWEKHLADLHTWSIAHPAGDKQPGS